MSDLLPFVLFALASSATPGPNNALIAASAAHHGPRAVVPHALGISLGFGAMVALVGLGLAGPLAASPALHGVLRWVGAAWMVWIAWQIARADAPGTSAAAPRMGFWAAAGFQWVNPKAWLIAVAATATYTDARLPLVPQVLLLAAVFALVALPCLAAWAVLGAGAGRLLRAPGRAAHPGRMRAFNLCMAALLLASVVPAVLG